MNSMIDMIAMNKLRLMNGLQPLSAWHLSSPSTWGFAEMQIGG